MNSIQILIVTLFLFLLENLYFKFAEKYGIVDKPNHRSSHTGLTLRGGGIIFSLSLLLYPLYFGLSYPYFTLGLAIISFISFVDDIKPLSSKMRILFHLVAVALLFYQLDIYQLPFYFIALALVFVIGSINAINFMDGINGITGSYALITLLTLLFINTSVINFVEPAILVTIIIAVVVFNFFNFRKIAKCFAGDVGSVSIAFIILFFLLKLIIKTENFCYLLLLTVYGLDTVTTIFFRIMRKENIVEAHRSHFYQYWANERRIPHLLISFLYAIVQLLINAIIIFFIPNSVVTLFALLSFCAVGFVIIRFSIEGSTKLLGH